MNSTIKHIAPRTKAIATLVFVVALAIYLVVANLNAPTPITEQNCTELVATLHGIQHDEEPGQSFQTQSDASAQAVVLNARVEQLGGCPGQKELQ